MPPARRSPTPSASRRPRSAPPMCEGGRSRREAWLAQPTHQWMTPGALAVAPYTTAPGWPAVEVLGEIQQVGTHPWREDEIPRVVFLRPPGGGIEWTARVDEVRQPPAALAAAADGK
ncbi:hypothetical protein ACGF07_31775 [Kitasatospora sp. NPDC048194]|uniref:hypothetical protein n=1 Tax=Kitasatospora sp. NPDC048194 TaxID=3364045 RepID=UPI00370FBB70